MAREEVPMSLRRTIVEIDPATLNVTRFCRDHGISTWFFWDLRRRFAREGEAVLEPKSRAAHRVANKTPVEVEDEIVRKRKELVDAGLDAGGARSRSRWGSCRGCRTSRRSGGSCPPAVWSP